MSEMIFGDLKISQDVDFGKMTTMKLGGKAKFFAEIENVEQIRDAIRFSKERDLPIYILGDGSNTLVRDSGFSGIVLKNKIMGFKKLHEDENSAEFKLGAGENWDKFVRFAVNEGFSGCEAMAMIPGTVGALPIQNVGAYGQETKDIMTSCEAVNLKTGEIENFSNEDCRFSYRESIFRSSHAGEYFIISVSLRLFKAVPKPPFYNGIEDYFKAKNRDLNSLSAKDLMNAVVEIRSEKLPDPEKIPSAGSFFKNAIISAEKAEEIRSKFGENAPIFPFENGKFKVATGWLIDMAGLRGVEIYGMKPHPRNALILTNISAKSFADLERARTEIQKAVKEKFGIEIEQEPLEI